MTTFKRDDWVEQVRDRPELGGRWIGRRGTVTGPGKTEGCVMCFWPDMMCESEVKAEYLEQLTTPRSFLLVKRDGKIFHDSNYTSRSMIVGPEFAPRMPATWLDWLRATGVYWETRLAQYGVDAEVWLAVESGQAFVYERVR